MMGLSLSYVQCLTPLLSGASKPWAAGNYWQNFTSPMRTGRGDTLADRALVHVSNTLLFSYIILL